MNKKSLELLEKVFSAEVESAFGGSGIFQTKSKLARSLEAEGYLQKVTTTLGGRFPVTIEGYCLTHLGRMAYCESCEEPP